MCDRSCRITKLAGQSLCSLFLCCVPDSHKGDRPATERELESTPDTHPSVSADLPPDVGGKGCGYRKHIRLKRRGGVLGYGIDIEPRSVCASPWRKASDR